MIQKNDTPDSLVPLLYRSTSSLDTAVEKATATIAKARQDFDVAASRLWVRYGPDADVHQFISACRANCTGNLHWRYVRLTNVAKSLIFVNADTSRSLLTGRYGLGLQDVQAQTVVVL